MVFAEYNETALDETKRNETKIDWNENQIIHTENEKIRNEEKERQTQSVHKIGSQLKTKFICILIFLFVPLSFQHRKTFQISFD